MRPTQITRRIQIDLCNHTADINRAADEYATTPNAACLSHDCYELAPTGDVVCRSCRRLRDEAKVRMAEARKKEKNQ